MNTIYFGCTKLSSIAPWIQLRQERNCTHNAMLPLGSHSSPGSDGRGQYRGWGQAISGADCGGVDWHKIGFYPCSCKSCMISCTATSLHEESQTAICHCSFPLFPIRLFTWDPKPAFKCLTSETPARNVLLKHFHDRNFCNLQPQQ